jgi:hypothetical protein
MAQTWIAQLSLRGLLAVLALFLALSSARAAESGEVDPQTYILAEDAEIPFRLDAGGGGTYAMSFCFGRETAFRERTPGRYQISRLRSCESQPPSPSTEAVLRQRLSVGLALIDSVHIADIKAKSETAYARRDDAPYAIPQNVASGDSKGRVYFLRYDLKFPASRDRRTPEFCLGEGSSLGKSARTGRFIVRDVQPCRSSTARENAEAKKMEGRILALSRDIEDDLRDVSYEIGFSWGLLVVPYKFQLSGDREMRGGTTVGTFLGLKGAFADLGVGLTPFVFAGAGNTSVRQIIGGKEVDNKLFALSYGGGLMFSIDDAFTAGVVVGFDHVDDTAGYAYNDKPWAALQLGYDFTK